MFQRNYRWSAMARLVLLTVLVFGATLAAAASTPAARADTEWFGSYQGKTYRTDQDYWPVGINWGVGGYIYRYCYGGVWGETYYGGSGSYSGLWTDSYDLQNGSYTWIYEGYHYSSGGSTYVHTNNSHCSAGATDHYPNGSYVGTTSDGFDVYGNPMF